MTTPFDKTAYRQALGGFPTGVCIISTYDANGVPLGITANSFTSVSMDPPLLLWCPSQSSSRHEVFVKTPHFAINVLCHSDEHLAKAIAADGHKITGAGLRASNGKAPVIENCVAVFECKQHATHAAGDHTIIVGEVEAFSYTPQPALLFNAGRFYSTQTLVL